MPFFCVMDSSNFQIQEGKRVYFASDFHLGSCPQSSSVERERKLIRWLDQIKGDAQMLILLGDVFDFWFEYQHVVPKGYVRFLGKLAEFHDAGIEVVLFSGNHDIWYRDYLEREIGIRIWHNPVSMQLGAMKFFLAHGDALGKGDAKFKVIKKVFTNPLCIWLFRWLHPDVGVWLARVWSSSSRTHEDPNEARVKEERLVAYCEELQMKSQHDYYVFGDTHRSAFRAIANSSFYVNLGEWFDQCSYGVYDGAQLLLKQYED